jgi:hypothetical protein
MRRDGNARGVCPLLQAKRRSRRPSYIPENKKVLWSRRCKNAGSAKRAAFASVAGGAARP